MPECTEAERQLIDAVIAGGKTSELVKVVVAERVDPELRQRALQAWVAVRRAIGARQLLTDELVTRGLFGQQLVDYLTALDHEAAELVAAEVNRE